MFRQFTAALYLFPVLLTWLHLRSAVDGFAKFGASQTPDANLNFLSYWAGGYGGAINSTTLQTAAFQVAGVVLLIIPLQAYVAWRDEQPLSRETIPPDLLLDAQLHFASRKVLTPQELAESIAGAAGQLENAIISITDQVRNAEALVSMVAAATREMAAASDKLSDASGKLDGALEPLVRIGDALDATDTSIRTSAGALDQVGRKISDLSQDLVVVSNAAGEVAEGLNSVVPGTERLLSAIVEATRTVDAIVERMGRSVGATGSEFSRELLDSARALGSVLDGTGRTLAELLQQGGRGFAEATRDGAANIRTSANGIAEDLQRVVVGADAVAQRLEGMSAGIADHAPIAETLGAFVANIDQVVHNILNAVSEIKIAAETYRDVNKSVIREASRGPLPGQRN